MGGKPRRQAVRRGQLYRVLRPGRRAIYVRILGVTRDAQQPKARYCRVTCSGRRVERKDAPPIVHWLQWDDGAWSMGVNYELEVQG